MEIWARKYGEEGQERGDSEGSPDGQLRDQNGGGEGTVQRFQMGGPGLRLGEWAQSGP